MALKNSFIAIIFIFAALNASAKSYPELIAKQSNDNIRLISADGKFTYYQRRSGSLHFSKNYKIIDVLKAAQATQYTMYSTNAKKKIVISQNINFHTFLSLRMKEKLYVMNYGEAIPREIGDGVSPALHLDDQWVSYYDPYLKTLNFEHTINYALKFTIKLNNKLNPYFTPQVVMLDENTILYTDLGENGNYGLVEYKRNLNESKIIHKTNNSTTRLEIIKCNSNFIYAELGFPNSHNGTYIYSSPLDIQNLSKKERVYASELDDIGHITCDFTSDMIYFVKNTGDKNNSIFEINELDLKTKKENLLTDLKTTTTIINMDGMILTFDRGKYLIVKGEKDLKSADSLKLNSKEAPKPNLESEVLK
jgi:hypothetical protein